MPFPYRTLIVFIVLVATSMGIYALLAWIGGKIRKK